jgi:hypothetical protein
MTYLRGVIRRLTPGMWRRCQDRICPGEPLGQRSRSVPSDRRPRGVSRSAGTALSPSHQSTSAIPLRRQSREGNAGHIRPRSGLGKRVRASLLTGCWRRTGVLRIPASAVTRCCGPATRSAAGPGDQAARLDAGRKPELTARRPRPAPPGLGHHDFESQSREDIAARRDDPGRANHRAIPIMTAWMSSAVTPLSAAAPALVRQEPGGASTAIGAAIRRASARTAGENSAPGTWR